MIAKQLTRGFSKTQFRATVPSVFVQIRFSFFPGVIMRPPASADTLTPTLIISDITKTLFYSKGVRNFLTSDFCTLEGGEGGPSPSNHGAKLASCYFSQKQEALQVHFIALTDTVHNFLKILQSLVWIYLQHTHIVCAESLFVCL